MKNTTLMYLRRGDDILLAMKKRGFGAGKWNAPGGKAEPGEHVHDAAIRECKEEVGVTPTNPVLLGNIEFYMPSLPDFPGHHIYIYSATEWEGEPTETEEMRPQWFSIHDLPYSDMWPADRRWLPEALAMHGHYFSGKIVQGLNDILTEYDVHPAEPPVTIPIL